ncbi:sensor domain-containing diguanylate cyclase [Allochromatium palmeri]|uniref:Diguanylate cyclase n=1 Tax=Allochromatium palmeri TaxID=231048 RepID=A0A6N8E7H0_9GAMM|nr:sensor domain-containing diguanylate cyclase [Allochromatium palmeri]MTW20193.1 diguanylate cyclase [Allochromatium palmeri]
MSEQTNEGSEPNEHSADAEPGLRARAEQHLHRRAYAPLATLTPEAIEHLIHELRVHQIELELQNEELHRAQDELALLHARYFDLYELAPVGYLTLSEAGVIQEANLAAATLLGVERHFVTQQRLTHFIHPGDQDIHYQAQRRLRSMRKPQSYELRLRREQPGPACWVSLDICLAPETQPPPAGSCRVVLVDITARKRVEQSLRDSGERLRLVTEIAGLSCWEWEPRTDHVMFPPDWHWPPSDAPDIRPTCLVDWSDALHLEDRGRTLAQLGEFVADPTGACEIQYRLRGADGRYRWFSTQLAPLCASDGALERVLLIDQDVTRRKESEEHAIRLAQQDPLTGLPTRALFDQIAQHMLASTSRAGHQLAVLFFDLDRFKAVNDQYGHAIGDQLLQAVAQRLRAAFRAEDLVARLGGDEFIVVLANVRDTEHATRVARHAIDILTPAYRLEGLELELKCFSSLGVSLFPRDGDSIQTLLQQADRALYQAKRSNPGGYWFASDPAKP